jgi:hypothetical protein
VGTPISLRKIPPHALRMAHRLSEQTGLSIADLLRQAVISGLLVEATKFAPDEDGTLGGSDPASLAKALRRHLSSAIDLLVEYGEHPHQGAMGQGEKPQQENHRTFARTEALAFPKPGEEQNVLFEHAIGDDLAQLGIGMSLAEIVESEGTSSKMLK